MSQFGLKRGKQEEQHSQLEPAERHFKKLFLLSCSWLYPGFSHSAWLKQHERILTDAHTLILRVNLVCTGKLWFSWRLWPQLSFCAGVAPDSPFHSLLEHVLLLMTDLPPSSSIWLMNVAASTLLLLSFVGELQKGNEKYKITKMQGSG